MRVTVIGCSGSFAGPDSAASCYLLEAPDPTDPERTWRILLDLGSGALGSLQRFADPLLVDGVFLTHLHPDHFFDLSGYYVLRKYHPLGPQPRIPVFGPEGTGRRIARAYGLALDPGMTTEFGFVTYDGSPVRVGPFTVTTRRMDHPVEAYALRVEHDGRALVYSGDTAATPDLVDLATGAEVLLCEAAFRDDVENPPHVHMTGSQAAHIARDAGVGRLVLTHVPPWHDRLDALAEATGAWDGHVELAHEGAVYEV